MSLSVFPPVPPRVPDRAPDGPPRPLRVFTPASRRPVPPPSCDRCGADVDTLNYDRAGGGELLCGPCVRVLTIAHSPADLKPIRLIQPRLQLETK